jgi:hypothetical protein
VVYAPFEQRLNCECTSSPCSQMQSGCLFLMDGCRTLVLRRYVTSRVCRSLHPLHWFKLVNHLSSASSVVSMTVLAVVLSMLFSTALGLRVASMTVLGSCRRCMARSVASRNPCQAGMQSCLEFCRASKLSADVSSPILKECPLCNVVRCAVLSCWLITCQTEGLVRS